MIYRLHEQIQIKTSLEEAWSFFSDPQNLKCMTPPDLDMQITSPLESEIYPGMIITYKVHPFLSIPVTWVTEITHVQKPQMFVDEQRYGPYRLWHHQHHFMPNKDGVIVEDIVDYIMPYGAIGTLAHSLLIRNRLRKIFDFRAAFLSKRYGAIGN